MMDKKVKIPSGQRLWQTVYDGKGNVKWYITSDAARTKYNLYFCSSGTAKKVKTDSSPESFREIMEQK